MATASTNAFAEEHVGAGRARAHHGHLYHHGYVHHGVAHRVAPGHRGAVATAPLGAGAAAAGVVYAPRCGYAPYPPCH
jgi:hypothetical protein